MLLRQLFRHLHVIRRVNRDHPVGVTLVYVCCRANEILQIIREYIRFVIFFWR